MLLYISVVPYCFMLNCYFIVYLFHSLAFLLLIDMCALPNFYVL